MGRKRGGHGPKGMLAVLAGGGASAATRALHTAGAIELVSRLSFFGIVEPG